METGEKALLHLFIQLDDKAEDAQWKRRHEKTTNLYYKFLLKYFVQGFPRLALTIWWLTNHP